ncbi:uncharacterized protein BO97DRAFT_39345 [Aspergillus homomorphus CBS 101889]|uniref:Uncharacterized protein n=1 Tax=Aspergillus homomorphus (strain CBS 101889) TaxID=1450537 RepID=A0A395I168_ASPHC|nr:hypothetical protein BO97DRAFT_39345 [Aspergillus homomorphus CBS 101889]RAL13475.1 hypothetical protein BO97DRAFT_39345 [Aspergillus homomorphus CBS 101889]
MHLTAGIPLNTPAVMIQSSFEPCPPVNYGFFLFLSGIFFFFVSLIDHSLFSFFVFNIPCTMLSLSFGI